LNPPDTASLSEYAYTAPKGSRAFFYPDVIFLDSVALTGEQCRIALWSMTPSAGDLRADADLAWARVFREFEARPTMTFWAGPHFARGVAAQGWEYFIIKKGIVFRGSPVGPDTPQFFGFVMVAKLGNRVATLSGLSKDPLVSACFGTKLANLWPRFFSTLNFKNWAPTAGAGFAERIQGLWESYGSSVGGGALGQHVFTAAGRYAEIGILQRYMALSRYETAIWTSKTFGDGGYTIRGNQLLLTPDRGNPEVRYIRLEQVSEDGGKTWLENLYLLQSNPGIVGGCGPFPCGNDDIEVRLQRRSTQ